MARCEETRVHGIVKVSALRACRCEKYVNTYWLLKVAVRLVHSTLWERQSRESDLSTNEAAVSAVHPRHDEA